MTLEALEAGAYRDIVRRALAEDLGWGDATTQAVIAPETRATGTLIMRSTAVVAGLDVALEPFRQLDPGVVTTSLRHDGELCGPGDALAEVTGLAAPLLTAERTALNFLCHLSGVATLTRRCVEASRGRLQIADTRKTLPLLRPLQKYAVRVGGGVNGRFSLDEGLILKANHLRVAGGVREAVARARAAGAELPIQVEAATLGEVDEALLAGAAVILFTGTSVDEVRSVVARCAGLARVEITTAGAPESIEALAAAGADFVSIGALTDSAVPADITLELRRV